MTTSTGVILVAPIARSKNRRAALASLAGGDEHVDDLPELVDRTVNVVPLTGDLRIGLVDLPAVADSVAARLGGVGQQRREAHHPPVDGYVVDLDTALGEQRLDVAVGQPEAQVPATATTMTSGGNRNPAKPERGGSTAESVQRCS